MILRLLLLLAFSPMAIDVSALGIPGTTQTNSGYDTELGEDPICWSSTAANTLERVDNHGIVFPNKLVEDFVLGGEVNLMTSCPDGTHLEVEAPLEYTRDHERLRTLRWYNYTVRGSIDISNLDGAFIASDDKSRIAVQIITCDTLSAGFCSPFVHEQSNARLKAAGITTKPARGDRHGGTHVHSPSVFIDFPIVENERFEFEVQLPIIINDPGDFFPIGTIQFFTGDTPNDPFYRYDVANALSVSNRLMHYQDPAIVLEVSQTVRILVYVTVAIVACVILYLLKETLKHYKSQVLQLSQAPFLVAFLLSALVATLATPLLEPRKDFMCLTSYPIILVSLHLAYAITIGRLWRIHAVISPLLRQRMQRQSFMRSQSNLNVTGFRDRFFQCILGGSNDNTFRKQVSLKQVVMTVSICTFPQILFQVLALIFQPRHMTVEFNSDESVGREICGSEPPHVFDNKFLDALASVSLLQYSFYALLVLILLLLLTAHFSRQLPSLFNESQIIFDSTLISVLLLILGLGVLALTDSPTTPPDVEYLVWAVVILTSTIQISLRIMLPKLKMVWDGEVVLVSKLVSDHRQSAEAKQRRNTGVEDPLRNVSGLNYSVGPSKPYTMHSGTSDFYSGGRSDFSGFDDSSHVWTSGRRSKQSINSSIALDNPVEEFGGDKDNDDSENNNNSAAARPNDETEETQGSDITPPLDDVDQRSNSSKQQPEAELEEGRNGTFDNDNNDSRKQPHVSFSKVQQLDGSSRMLQPPEEVTENETKGGSKEKTNKRRKKKLAKTIVVKQGETPARRLVLKMVDLQEQLDTVTSRIMSGLGVSEDDWISARELTDKLQTTFKRVQFYWEEEAADGASNNNSEEREGLLAASSDDDEKVEEIIHQHWEETNSNSATEV